MAHHKSVLELQGCLRGLRKFSPRFYSHLMAYRCNAEWRQSLGKTEFLGPTGKMLEGRGWKKERIVPRWINLGYVAAGELYLAREFSGQVFIPNDLWDGLTKPVSS